MGKLKEKKLQKADQEIEERIRNDMLSLKGLDPSKQFSKILSLCRKYKKEYPGIDYNSVIAECKQEYQWLKPANRWVQPKQLSKEKDDELKTMKDKVDDNETGQEPQQQAPQQTDLINLIKFIQSRINETTFRIEQFLKSAINKQNDIENSVIPVQKKAASIMGESLGKLIERKGDRGALFDAIDTISEMRGSLIEINSLSKATQTDLLEMKDLLENFRNILKKVGELR